MKSKLVIASLLLAGACAANLSAQEKTNYYTPKWSDNIFVSVGGGVHAINNDGFNKLAPHFSVSVGKLITPTWGVRAQFNGVTQHLCLDNSYWEHNKTYFGGNIDAMINLSTLFAGVNPNRFFEVYGFLGPQVTVAKSANVLIQNDGTMIPDGDEKARARVGASAGLGLKFNINTKWAIDVEARGAIAPSVFGNISSHRKAEGTGTLTAGVSYIFGGKKFIPVSKIDEDAVNAEINRYRSELAQAQADLANCKNALANAKPEVKEVTKEVEVAGPRAIFFKIGSARLDDYGKVNIQLAAKILKANPDRKYKVAGYCDKATGSASWNQKLSEKRAQVVYDALIAEGVSKDQLELVGFGGTENMFGKNFLNRVVILE